MSIEEIKNRKRNAWEYLDFAICVLHMFQMSVASIFLIDFIGISFPLLVIPILFGIFYCYSWFTKNPFMMTMITDMLIVSLFLIFPIAIDLSILMGHSIPVFYYILIYPIFIYVIYYLIISYKTYGLGFYMSKSIAMKYGYIGYGRIAKKIMYRDFDTEKRKQEIDKVNQFKKCFHKKRITTIAFGYVVGYLALFIVGHSYFFTVIK